MLDKKTASFVPLRRHLLRLAAASAMSAGLLHAPAQAQDPEAAATSAERLIVSGASGQLGGLVVEELLAQGVTPDRLILVSRTPGKLERYAAMGAAVRYGDFTEPESLPEAYSGGSRMLLISIGGASVSRPEAHGNAIRAAADAGIRHIAYTSWIGISHGETGGLSTDHAATEEILRDSGVAWTMLRNSIYADGLVQEAAEMIAAGHVEVPENADPIAYITREDCAAAAAAVLITPGHENRAYDITGPKAVGLQEVAEAASAVTGVQMVIERAPASEPQPFGGRAVGTVSDDFERLTGRRPTSVRDLLDAHRGELLVAAGRAELAMR